VSRVLPWVLAVAALGFGVWKAPPGLFTAWSLTTVPTGERLSQV